MRAKCLFCDHLNHYREAFCEACGKKIFENIFKAVEGNSMESIEKFLEIDGRALTKTNDNGMKIIHIAVREGRKDLLEYLLEKGAQVDERNEFGYTPLHVAAMCGQTDLARFLIGKKAQVKATDPDMGSTPLHEAVRNCHSDLIELLIQKGADINAKNKNGETPLRIARREGIKDVVSYLKNCGASE
ncbi:MAG: ankyrin repeat domain-containing protein [Candidatus Eremiobacteraeota bacterium]|nr:ankyrin repeat domain-containing protein [Candidatus Eremiobacteraeota bacterium]